MITHSDAEIIRKTGRDPEQTRSAREDSRFTGKAASRMDVYSLKCFLTVVEEKNITRAARRLFVTQQTLSSIIQRLENEFQATLFERKPNLRLTSAGEVVRTYALEIVRSGNAMQNALADVDKNCRTTIHFGISELRARAFFPSIWKEFHSSHPSVSVALYSGRTESFFQSMATGKIDLFLGYNARPHNSTVCRPVAREQLVCLISSRFLKKHFPEIGEEDLACFVKEGIDPEQLRGLPCIRLRLDPGRGKTGLEPILYNAMVEVDQFTTIHQMVSDGIGFGLVSPCYYYNHLDEYNRIGEDLWILPLRCKMHPFIISVVYPDTEQPEYITDFIDSIERGLQDYNAFAEQLSHFESEEE